MYDRRGEGRSVDPNAKFTYNEAFEDLNNIYEKYKIKRANLIGHSLGGLVATLYSEEYPRKISSLILAGALVSQQETYDHILNSVKKIYAERDDSTMLQKVLYVEQLNKKSAEYRKECFELANDNGYFKVTNPTEHAIKLYGHYEGNKTNIRNGNAPKLFYRNEMRTNIDTEPVLKKLKSEGVIIYAIYGKQDRIFSVAQIDRLNNLMGKGNFNYIENCSHYLFVDQQEIFLESIEKWLSQ